MARVARLLALVVAGLLADRSRALRVALRLTGVGAAATLRHNDDDRLLLLRAGRRAGRHAGRGALRSTGVRARRLAGGLAHRSRARRAALLVALAVAVVLLRLDHDDLVVVVIVSANWTTGLLTIAVLRGTGGLAILLARTTLILRLDNDHLRWWLVSALRGTAGLARTLTHGRRAGVAARLLAGVAVLLLLKKDQLLTTTAAALLITAGSAALKALLALARRLTLLHTHRETLSVLLTAAGVGRARTTLTLRSCELDRRLVRRIFVLGEDDG